MKKVQSNFKMVIKIYSPTVYFPQECVYESVLTEMYDALITELGFNNILVKWVNRTDLAIAFYNDIKTFMREKKYILESCKNPVKDMFIAELNTICECVDNIANRSIQDLIRTTLEIVWE